MSEPTSDVIVITGAGGMGAAILRRIGSGATVVLADLDQDLLDREVGVATTLGYDVVSHVVDVSDRSSVEALAAEAAERGRVVTLVHTAGLSPVQASPAAIARVDLLGTALVLDAFEQVIAPGGAGVVIASMAGSMLALGDELEAQLAWTPTDGLLDLPALAPDVLTDSGMAYVTAKRGNQLRVQVASVAWGRRGARINAISPGIISTPMGAEELAGPNGDGMRSMIAAGGRGRVGTPEDIAAAVEFLVGRQADFITGTNLLVDGGVVAAVVTPRP